jgi:hypothetical protein
MSALKQVLLYENFREFRQSVQLYRPLIYNFFK